MASRTKAKAKSAPGSASNGHLSTRNLMQTLPPEIVLNIAKSAAHPYTVKSLSTAVTNSRAKKLLNNLYIKRIQPATTALERKHAVFKLHHPQRIVRTPSGLVNKSNHTLVFRAPQGLFHMRNIATGTGEIPVWIENQRGRRSRYGGLHGEPYATQETTGPLKGKTTLFEPGYRMYGRDNTKQRAIYNSDEMSLFRVYKNGVNYLTRVQHGQHVPNSPVLLMGVYSRPANNGRSRAIDLKEKELLATELLQIYVQPDGKLFFQLLDPRNGFKLLQKYPEIKYNRYNKNGKPSSSAKPISVTLSDGTLVRLLYRSDMLVQATVKRNGDNSPLHSVGLVAKGSFPDSKHPELKLNPFRNLFSGANNTSAKRALRPDFVILQHYFTSKYGQNALNLKRTRPSRQQ